MKNFIARWMLCLLLLVGGTLSAQEGTYVVTRKADKIPVYNHDDEVIGYLKRGDKVFVTLFHQPLPQTDGSVSEPVTFVEYQGQEGILHLESPEWMKCLEPTEANLDPDGTSADPSLPEQSISLIFGLALGNLLLLLCVAKPLNLIFWQIRDRMKRKGVALATGVLTLVWCALELYIVYTLDDPLWFSRWREVGFLKMIGGLAGMLLWIGIQLVLLNSVVASLAGMQKTNYRYFDYGMALLVSFVGTWLILILDTWQVNWKFEAQIGIAIAVLIYLGFSLRHVIRHRSILSALLILLILLTGVPLLCYVSLEAFSRIMEIVLWLIIAKIVIQGLSSKRFGGAPSDGDEIVEYFDYENGITRQLFKDGNNGYIDFSDGSHWGKRGDSGDFNRYW